MAADGAAAVVDRESDRGVLLDFEQHEPQKTANLSQRFENLIGPPVAFEPTLEFAGKQLSINMATSAAGSIRVEIQQPDGTLPSRILRLPSVMKLSVIKSNIPFAGRVAPISVNLPIKRFDYDLCCKMQTCIRFNSNNQAVETPGKDGRMRLFCPMILLVAIVLVLAHGTEAQTRCDWLRAGTPTTLPRKREGNA